LISRAGFSRTVGPSRITRNRDDMHALMIQIVGIQAVGIQVVLRDWIAHRWLRYAAPSACGGTDRMGRAQRATPSADRDFESARHHGCGLDASLTLSIIDTISKASRPKPS
jgi:hypothetical protein